MDSIVSNLLEFISREVTKMSNGTDKTMYKCILLKYFEDAQLDPSVVLNELKVSYDIASCVASSKLLLGIFKFYGIMDKVDNETAFKLFNESANSKYIFSNYYIGVCFKHGLGTIKNVITSYYYFYNLTKSEKLKSLGLFEIGEYHNNIIDEYENAIEFYQAASKNGSLIALYRMGQKYLNGMRVVPNYNKSFEYFMESANGDFLDGILMVGVCYSHGIGVNVDKNLSFKYFEKSARLGHMIAQYNLANSFEFGEGIALNLEQAINWYQRSYNSGYTKAGKDIARLLKPT